MNEYTAIGPAGAQVARGHDPNGNRTDDGARVLVWDAFNRLVGVARKSDGAPIAAYGYLPDGRRSRKVVYSQATPGQIEREVRFVWDGAQEVEEQSAAGGTLASYVWSPVYVDELVEYRREAAHPLGAGSFFAHQDARCDVVAVTNAAGQVVESRRYDDFGRGEIRDAGGAVVAGSPSGLEYGFQGRRRDPETGWLYFRARYYSAEEGRFLSRDPVWDASNVGGAHTFVGNGPLSGRDPSGLTDKTRRNPAGDKKAPGAAQPDAPTESGPGGTRTSAPARARGLLRSGVRSGLRSGAARHGPGALLSLSIAGQFGAWEFHDAARDQCDAENAAARAASRLAAIQEANAARRGTVKAFGSWFRRTSGRAPAPHEVAAYETALNEGLTPEQAAKKAAEMEALWIAHEQENSSASQGGGDAGVPRVPNAPTSPFDPDPDNFVFTESSRRHGVTEAEMRWVISHYRWTRGTAGVWEACGQTSPELGGRYIETAFTVRAPEAAPYTGADWNYEAPSVHVHHGMPR